jgi:hypothetical protein
MKMFRYYWKQNKYVKSGDYKGGLFYQVRSFVHPSAEVDKKYGYPTEEAAVKAYNDSGCVLPLVLIKQYEDVPDDVVDKEQILSKAKEVKALMDNYNQSIQLFVDVLEM